MGVLTQYTHNCSNREMQGESDVVEEMIWRDKEWRGDAHGWCA
jgi:hypothetical protein